MLDYNGTFSLTIDKKKETSCGKMLKHLYIHVRIFIILHIHINIYTWYRLESLTTLAYNI